MEKAIELVELTQSLNDKQKEVFTECAKQFTGFSYKEAETVLFELMNFIKAASLVQEQGL